MKKLLKQIVNALVNNANAINATVDHLDALGVKVDGRGVVATGKTDYVKLRDGLAAQYFADVECSKEHAAKVAREFLTLCGYRERAKKHTAKKKTPTNWKKAVMKSVKYATKGDRIMIGDAVYTRA